jgi:hypothetical protein
MQQLLQALLSVLDAVLSVLLVHNDCGTMLAAQGLRHNDCGIMIGVITEHFLTARAWK